MIVRNFTLEIENPICFPKVILLVYPESHTIQILKLPEL